MKTLFIPTKVKSKINKEKIVGLSKKLPKNIALLYSIQFEGIASQVKDLLKNNNITLFAQALGCTRLVFPKDTEALLLIGSGRFHAISLALETKLPIYILEQDRLYSLSEREIEKFSKKQKAGYLKFLHSDRVGFLVSTKPGQNFLKRAIKEKNLVKNKKSYLFLGDNINSQEFENFYIDAWVNTACPRLDMDYPVLNIADLENNQNGKSK